MRTRRRLSSGDLLLLELVFAIVFFCLAMAASMSVFGNSYEMSSKAEKLDISVRESDSVAEIIRSADTVEEIRALLEKNGFTMTSGDVYTRAFNEGSVRITVSAVLQGKLYTALISCFDTPETAPGEPVYEIEIKHSLSPSGVKGGSDG